MIAPTIKDVKQVLREVYKRQGYIVIGQPPHAATTMRVGEETHKIFQYDMGTPFLLSARATQSDWNKQGDLIAKLRPSWSRLPNQKGARFFKLLPVVGSGKPRLVA